MSLGKFNLAMTGLDPRIAGVGVQDNGSSTVVKKKLTVETAEEIRDYFKKHFNGRNKTLLCAALADRYDKGESTIRGVINNQTHINSGDNNG